MKKIFLFVTMFLITSLAHAEVIRLICDSNKYFSRGRQLDRQLRTVVDIDTSSMISDASFMRGIDGSYDLLEKEINLPVIPSPSTLTIHTKDGAIYISRETLDFRRDIEDSNMKGKCLSIVLENKNKI